MWKIRPCERLNIPIFVFSQNSKHVLFCIYGMYIASKLFCEILQKYEETNKMYILRSKTFVLRPKTYAFGLKTRPKTRFILYMPYLRNILRQNQIFNFAKKSLQLEYSITSLECRALVENIGKFGFR